MTLKETLMNIIGKERVNGLAGKVWDKMSEKALELTGTEEFFYEVLTYRIANQYDHEERPAGRAALAQIGKKYAELAGLDGEAIFKEKSKEPEAAYR